MENIINFISNIDNSTYNKIRHSKSDAECRRYLKEQLTLTDVSQCNDIKKPKFSRQTIIIIDRKDGLKDLYTDDGCIGVGLTNEQVKEKAGVSCFG